MMQDLVRILRDGELDRETKLRVIEIVSVSQDTGLVNDLVEVLKEWDAADNAMEKDITNSIAEVEVKYKIDLAQIEDASEKQIEQIESDVNKEDDISDLKKSILEN
jgi:hypothetical protein